MRAIHTVSLPVALLAALALLGACASPTPTPPASPPSGAVGAGAAARPAATSASAPAASTSGGAASAPTPGQPPAYAAVIRDAKKVDGLFTIYQKDEKFWLELKPADFDRPFFLSPKLASGIGEARFLGGLMAAPQLVRFRRVHNLVQLLVVNTEFVAKAGTPEGRAVEAAYSPSLLASVGVASQPHPQSKAILVEALPLFVNDMLGIGTQLGRQYRQGYGHDARNSAILAVRGKPDMVAVEVQNHYASASIAQPTPGSPPGMPAPSVPRTVPDPRSLFIRLHYSLAALPAEPMAARKADPRVGHFLRTVSDFSDDLARSPRVRHIARWRLEKKDVAAELSEPVKPITFWIDRTVPLKYRDAITAGIQEWNKAFERIGFKDAIQVKVQPDDADFDTLDFGVASVRWMVNASPSFGAIGPSHSDPRSGEIVDADIAFESLSSRTFRAVRASVLNATSVPAWGQLMQIASGATPHDPLECHHAEGAAEQLGYALELLDVRGDLDPAGPEADAFVQAYLKDTTMHEVGHALGLRHNFRASRVYSDRQLSDPEFTRTRGLSGSVMEYSPVNLPRPGEPWPASFETSLGPYDYWAIEYAYKPIAAAQEAGELARIAARSGEPELAYGTDEDQFLGIDPDALHFDLGDDPVAFARKRFEIAQDVFSRQEKRELIAERDYAALRRSLAFALRDAGRAAGILLRQIGGLRTLRDYPNTGRDPLQPVPAARQRDALDAVARHLLATGTFTISPALARRVAPDFLERADALQQGESIADTDYPLAQAVATMRATVLAQLMSDSLAVRLIDAERKLASPREAFRLSELYRRLDGAVWSELAGRGDIEADRRDLQRDHVNRLAALVLRPGALSRADARSLVRTQASELLARIEAAQRRGDLGVDARLHLKDSADTLRAALAAPLGRVGA